MVSSGQSEGAFAEPLVLLWVLSIPTEESGDCVGAVAGEEEEWVDLLYELCMYTQSLPLPGDDTRVKGPRECLPGSSPPTPVTPGHPWKCPFLRWVHSPLGCGGVASPAHKERLGVCGSVGLFVRRTQRQRNGFLSLRTPPHRVRPATTPCQEIRWSRMIISGGDSL